MNGLIILTVVLSIVNLCAFVFLFGLIRMLTTIVSKILEESYSKSFREFLEEEGQECQE